MMILISNGEPYVYTHKCTGENVKGDIMTMEEMQQFLVETLYESFLHCNSNIRKTDDSWKYRSEKRGIFQGLSSSLKQQPDLIYCMDGKSPDTWFYVMPDRDDISLIDMKFVNKYVERYGILPVLMVGDLWCFDTNGNMNICGADYAAKFEPISLLNDKNYPLLQELSQKQLTEKVALCWQKLDADIIEPYLDKDFHYSSSVVFYEMSSRREYIGYLRGKFNTLKKGTNKIDVKIGRMEGTNDFAILLHQSAYNNSSIININVKNGRITYMKMSEYGE